MFGKKGFNKRNYMRLKTYCLVKYSRVGGSGSAEEAVANLKNISEGGFLFTSFEPFHLSSLLKVSISLPFSERAIDTFGKVTRCTRIADEGPIYHVGVTFLDISEEQRKEIGKCIQGASSDRVGKKLLEKRSWRFLWRRKKYKVVPGTKGSFYDKDS